MSIRGGFSWPTGNGGRAWVSGPLWLLALWPGAGLLFWALIGWWLWLMLALAVLTAWVCAETLLMLCSLALVGYAAWAWKYRDMAVVLEWKKLPYGLIVLNAIMA